MVNRNGSQPIGTKKALPWKAPKSHEKPEGLTKKKEKGMYPRRGGGIFLPFFRTAAEIREPYRFDAGVHDREPHRFTAGVHGREPHRFAAAVHGSAHCCRSPDRLGDAKEWLLEQITVCIAALTGDRADSCRTWQTATGVRGLLRAAAAILRVLLTIAYSCFAAACFERRSFDCRTRRFRFRRIGRDHRSRWEFHRPAARTRSVG